MSLQEEYDQLNAKLIRATTLRDEALKNLKREFDCDSIEEAQSLLETMQTEADELESNLNDKLRRFKSKFAQLLRSDGEDD